MHEEVLRGRLSDVRSELGQRAKPQGEFTVVIGATG
jgi:hypothetical protein